MTARTLAPGCLGYPAGLMDCQAPPALRVKGALRDGPSVAIVGTRTPSDAAAAYAHDLAEELARGGISVWSGGAVGIDTAAHEGALDATGHTVVVVGGGLLHPYPPVNAPLFARVLSADGAMMSRSSDDAHPTRSDFFGRNAVLAAATDLLIIVECEHRSGARNAAWHARQLRRPRAVVLQAPWSGRGMGCFEELALGAIPLRHARHAVDLIEASRRERMVGEEKGPLDRAIVSAVQAGAADPDALCEALSEPANVVSAALLDLLLRGVLEQTHRGLIVASAAAPRQGGAP